jgi:hypothetical protein
MKFEYDHRNLSLSLLHQIGIRSTRELEEVIEWEYSYCEIAEYFLEFPVYLFSGLTKECKGIEIAVTFDRFGKFVTLDAKVADRNKLYFLLK